MTTIRLHVDHRGKTSLLTFSEAPIRIGRDPSNECRLEFRFVSRSHARIELNGGRLVLVDGGGRHGTWTRHGGHRRLAAASVTDLESIGYEFEIGPLAIRVDFQAEPEPRIETVLAPQIAPRIETALAHDGPIMWELAPLPSGEPARLPGFPGEPMGPPRLPALSVSGALPPEEQALARDAPDPIETSRRAVWTQALAALNPATIELELGGLRGRSPLRYRGLWEEFVRRHEELALRENVSTVAAGVNGEPPLGAKPGDC